jgi:hypothetical protein
MRRGLTYYIEEIVHPGRYEVSVNHYGIQVRELNWNEEYRGNEENYFEIEEPVTISGTCMEDLVVVPGVYGE